MTDATPNDLSHLSDDEFHALCPQGEHAPGGEPLSPGAQAVLNALNMDELNGLQQLLARAHAISVLRTLAGMPVMWINEDYLLAIANELEAHD
jgi:hypothetical protein